MPRGKTTATKSGISNKAIIELDDQDITKAPRKGREKKLAKATYEVRLVGLYFANGTDGKPGQYDVTCRMNEKMIQAGVLNSFKNHVARILLPRKYADYINVWTFEVVSHKLIEGSETETPLQLLSHKELIELIEEEGLPIETHLYADAGELRAAIAKFNEDEDGFLRQQEERSAKMSDVLDLRHEAAILNGFDDEDERNARLAETTGI